MQVQRVHRGRVSTGTDACINGTVAVKVRHVIDRGRRRCAVCKAGEQGGGAMTRREEGRVEKK
jgi:hypothetical protein